MRQGGVDCSQQGTLLPRVQQQQLHLAPRRVAALPEEGAQRVVQRDRLQRHESRKGLLLHGRHDCVAPTWPHYKHSEFLQACSLSDTLVL